MHIFRNLDDVPSDFGPTLVSVGNFDGVHRAHAYVLREIVARARSADDKAVAVTFEPHPARILRPEAGLKLLTPTAEKLRLLEATGIDAVLLLPFGRDLSLLTPRQFADRVLATSLHPRETHQPLPTPPTLNPPCSAPSCAPPSARKYLTLKLTYSAAITLNSLRSPRSRSASSSVSVRKSSLRRSTLCANRLRAT